MFVELTLLSLVLVSQSTHAHEPMFSSCYQILKGHPNAPSGEYSIRTPAGRVHKVYCEMGLNGGGYTFLNPVELPTLTNEEVQSLFTDKSNFLMRVRKTDNTQPYGVLRQLPQYQNIPLKLGLNEYSLYTRPLNVAHLDNNFLYYGFIPATSANNRNTQGLQVNGKSVAFTNCDSSPNSYIALFPNFRERAPSDYGTEWPFCATLLSSLVENPSRRVMPDYYFVFTETHWGGCGCYWQSDGRFINNRILGSAIGFR